MFQTALEDAKLESTALFLGDNIYPNGLPKKNEDGRESAKYQLDVQTAAAEKFKVAHTLLFTLAIPLNL